MFRLCMVMTCTVLLAACSGISVFATPTPTLRPIPAMVNPDAKYHPPTVRVVRCGEPVPTDAIVSSEATVPDSRTCNTDSTNVARPPRTTTDTNRPPAPH